MRLAMCRTCGKCSATRRWRSSSVCQSVQRVSVISVSKREHLRPDDAEFNATKSRHSWDPVVIVKRRRAQEPKKRVHEGPVLFKKGTRSVLENLPSHSLVRSATEDNGIRKSPCRHG